MGQMRFAAPRQDRLPPKAAERAYLAGMEGIPWQSFHRLERGQLILERSVSESGNLYVPWSVEGHGELMLSTTSLMERPQPYHLPVELARGTLSRLRNQLADWEAAGLPVTAALRATVRQAMQSFARAATVQHQAMAAAEHAEQAMRLALDAMHLLSSHYATQALIVRHQREPRLSTLLAGNMGPGVPSPDVARAFLATFNSAVVPFTWRDLQPNDAKFQWTVADEQVAWAQEHKMTLCGGPLLQLHAAHLPDWIYLWEDDFEDLQTYVWQFIEETVERYRGKVHVWHCAARMNVPGGLALSEEQKLRLVVGAMDILRRLDAKTPVFISFDQPWGEYLARQELDLSPLHFADALVRANVGLSGIGLELNWGYWPGGTQTRDLIELNRQLDRWASLGLPLLVVLTAPSSSGEDAQARQGIRALSASGANGPTLQTQDALVQRLVPLLLAKPAVHGIIWNQFCDARPHEFPHGGLLDAQSKPKPALQSLIALREQHLV